MFKNICIFATCSTQKKVSIHLMNLHLLNLTKILVVYGLSALYFLDKFGSSNMFDLSITEKTYSVEKRPVIAIKINGSYAIE